MPLEYLPDGRGSGRTYDQVAALPDGGVYVVAHVQDERQVKDALVSQGRRSDALRVVPVSSLYRLQGLNAPMDMGHYARDVATLEQLEVFAALNRWRAYPAESA